MSASGIRRWWSGRYVLAAVAGLLLTAGFPKIGIAGLAWIAPGLMIASALGKGGAERFRLGYVAGLAHYLSMLYWLLLIPYRWLGIPLGPMAGWVALSAFLALYPAVWVWLVAGVQASTVPTGESGLRKYAGVMDRRWGPRALWALAGGACWVALEMAEARVLGGFPWCLLGVSQYQLSPLIQISSVTGVYGVSFLVTWVSLALLSAALMLILKPSTRSVWVGEVFVPVLVAAIVFNFGFRLIQDTPLPTRTIKAALVQPNIPQTVIWDSSKDAERFRTVLDLTAQALTNKPDLLIWPESAVPEPIRYSQGTFDTITGIARSNAVWMIIGSDDIQPRAGAAKAEDREYFNASFLVSPEGELVERYVKRNLVIFGEFVPFEHVLPFLKFFTPITGGFTPGTGPVTFNLRTLNVKTSVLICFEDVFPHLARGDARPDTDFLVNLTNDGWFGESAAQWQQAATAVFRAVETGRPLVRAANNGLTCWVDSHGRIRDLLRDGRGTVYGAGWTVVDIPVHEKGVPGTPTFYSRHGDWFGWGCVGVGLAALAWRAFPRKSV